VPNLHLENVILAGVLLVQAGLVLGLVMTVVYVVWGLIFG